MNQEEYKNPLDREYKSLKYTLKRNTGIAVLGLAMSFELLAYNIAISMDGQEQSKKELVITKKIEKTIYALNKIQNIQNISVGLAGASGLYFLFGCGIPYAKYIKKKNPLEKDVI